jgi:cell wall-associated NlpC family hydrolase
MPEPRTRKCADCYTLFRDAYHLCGIDLPDFERTGGWWLRGENLYVKNMVPNGFHEIASADIRPGDVIIRRAFPETDPFNIRLRRVTADSTSDLLKNGSLWNSYTEITGRQSLLSQFQHVL